MGVVEGPAVNLARRVIEKYSLKPPVDINALIKKHAELIILDIPMNGVDGVTLNLKISGKYPKVILSNSMPQFRQRFTLAHELGHILIPWHTGNIIDVVNEGESPEADSYWQTEAEANSFAAELLMPRDWIINLISDRSTDYAKVHGLISEKCEVSLLAAAIRFKEILPSNLIYACEHANAVEFSGKTNGTIANALGWGSAFPKKPFAYCEKHYTAIIGKRVLHWWLLPKTISIKVTDDRGWREILCHILNDLGVTDTDELKKLKSSINGVFAYANSSAKRQDNYSVDTVISACVQRFSDKDGFEEFVSHQDFQAFIVDRVNAIFQQTTKFQRL